MKIKAALTLSAGAEFMIEEVELAKPKKTEVLIKMVGVGVCHTDAAARAQHMPTPLPAVLGHEGSGIVQEVGSEVIDIKPGDHVIISFYSCGHCKRCRMGQPTMCNDYRKVNLLGGVYADGTKRITTKEGQEVSCFFGQSTFAEYAIADQQNCIVIDKDVDLALMGPLGCGIQTGAGVIMNKLKPDVGSSIAVYGCGAVGLSAIMMAKNAGCTQIIGVDIVPSRLELAKELGATHVINGKEVDAVAEIMKITGEGADYSLETTAVPDLINQALYCLKLKGTCVVVGFSGDKVVPIKIQFAIMSVGKTLCGVLEGDSIPKVFIPKLVELYKSGKFPFDKLIKEYKFEEINKAFEDAHSGVAIKPIIRF